MKKKRIIQLCSITLVLVASMLGCGTDKNLTPTSDLILQRADPPSMNVGVNPPQTHQTYFVFTIRIDDKELSMIQSDAWTIDNYDISYTLLSDPGHHRVAVPASDHVHLPTKVKPGLPSRYPVRIVTDSYLQANALGFLGTPDKARVKAHVVFKVHRNRDGYGKTISAPFIFTIGDF